MASERADDTMRRYLLGDLDEDDRRLVEERMFTDAEYARELDHQEHDLIDEYVADALTADEREKYERHFLVGRARHQDVRFAKALRMMASTADTDLRSVSRRRRSWLGRSTSAAWLSARTAALAGLAAALVIGILTRETWTLRRSLETARQQQAAKDSDHRALETRLAEEQTRSRDLQDRNRALADQLERQRSAGATSSARHQARTAVLASFLLAPGVSRDAVRPATLSIPSGQGLIELKLQVPTTEYSSFSLSLRTVNGTEVWQQDRLAARRSRDIAEVSTQIPTNNLREDDYVIRLSGRTSSGRLEDVNSYFFRVVR